MTMLVAENLKTVLVDATHRRPGTTIKIRKNLSHFTTNQDDFKCPIRYIIQEYRPEIYDKIVKNKEDLGCYNSKQIKYFLNGTTHILFWEFRNILDILDLDITFSAIPDDTNDYIDHVYVSKHYKPYMLKRMVIQRVTPEYEKFVTYINIPAHANEQKIAWSHERQQKYFGQVYPKSHFDNPLLMLLESNGKEDKIFRLINDKTVAHKLGLRSNVHIENWLNNITHITWFDIINILRFCNLKLTYDVSYKNTNAISEAE